MWYLYKKYLLYVFANANHDTQKQTVRTGHNQQHWTQEIWCNDTCVTLPASPNLHFPPWVIRILLFKEWDKLIVQYVLQLCIFSVVHHCTVGLVVIEVS